MNLLLSLAFALASAAPVPEDPQLITGAVIQDYGPMPLAGSGVRMILRSVTVTTATGETRRLYFIHGAEGLYLGARHGTPYPAPGSICDLSTSTRRISGGGNFITGDGGSGGPEGQVIVTASCKP